MARRPPRRSDARAGGRGGAEGEVRIIGGTHRGRRVRFPLLPGLRPTGDRVKETLFNWLQPRIAGADCLDLFAGSGSLGLEAASRGAGSVLMLERADEAVRQLCANVAALGLDRARVERGDALAWLDRPAVERFDLVFLDPPFDQPVLGAACRLLTQRGWLTGDALVYVETAADDLPPLPKGWSPWREKRAGQVAYRLFQVSTGEK